MKHWFRPNSAKSWLQQRLRFGSYLEKYVTNWAGVCCNIFVKDVAIIYDNRTSVQEIFCEILTHMFIPAFSGTHGIPRISKRAPIHKCFDVNHCDELYFFIQNCQNCLCLNLHQNNKRAINQSASRLLEYIHGGSQQRSH